MALQPNSEKGILRSGPKKTEKSSVRPITFKKLLSNTVKIFDIKRSKEFDVVVKCTGELYDDNSIIPTYKTRSPEKRGRLLVINNIEFNGEKRRCGAEEDQRNIVALFTQIGFEIFTYQNMTEIDMKREVTNFATAKELKTCDICVVVLMSHGTTCNGDTVIETIDGSSLSTEWVVQQFDGNKCKGMKGKPKIFMFQCCRGNKYNKFIQADMCRSPKLTKLRQVQDILISYSTISGFCSYRTLKQGTWYIQALCKIFAEHCHNTPIEDLLKMVDVKLAKLNYCFGGQTSSYENRGFKRCYLHPIGK